MSSDKIKIDPFWDENSKLSAEEIDKRFPEKVATALKLYKDAAKNVKYTYFVSYFYNNGYGNVEITADQPITKFSEITEISFKIAKEVGTQNIAILNYILLNCSEK